MEQDGSKEEKMLQQLKDHEIEFVQMELIDLFGISRCIIVDEEAFRKGYKSDFHSPCAVLSIQVTHLCNIESNLTRILQTLP